MKIKIEGKEVEGTVEQIREILKITPTVKVEKYYD